MCRLFNVSRSGYYAWLRRPKSHRKTEDDALSQLIKEIHEESNREYGSPKIHQELRRRGKRCGRKRVARLMRKDGLKAKTIRKFKANTNSDHRLPVATNLLNRDFSPAEPNKAWVADITYIYMDERRLAVPRNCHRPVFTRRCWLVNVRAHDTNTGHGCLHPGCEAT